jgi:hypothetical protein
MVHKTVAQRPAAMHTEQHGGHRRQENMEIRSSIPTQRQLYLQEFAYQLCRFNYMQNKW